MKKTIFLFFATILCAIGVQAADITSDGTARLYFNMKAVSWWTAGTNGNGNFGYFFNNSTNKNAWSAHAVQYSGDTYYLVIPKGTWAGVILTRNNTSTAPSWDNKWNQTGDITLSSTSNYLSKFAEGSASVTWGTAVKPTSSASVTANPTTIFVGAQSTLSSALTSNADINTNKSTSYSVSPATGSVESGKFTATAAGEYTVTATVTYHPNGYASITSTATATATITVEEPTEETHNVNVLYKFGETEIADPTTVNTVGVETSVKVTAPEIAKYTFSNWILGADVTTEDALTNTAINITTKAGGSDFTLTANYEKAKLTYTVTVPAGTENCYMAGEMNSWDVENPIELTKQSENVFTITLEGVDKSQQYKYLSQKGSWDYADVQDANRTWSAEDVVTAWKDPLATNVFLAGDMNGWNTTANEFRKAAKDGADASIILNLTKGTYKFKIVDNGSWLGNNGTIDKTISGWTFEDGKNDCPLKATIAGDYTFTWAISTKKLSVTYPTICAITATANDAAMGTIAGAGDYGKGSTATLTATPNDGYLFVNWTKGGEEVATTQEYSFTVTEAVELVANFEAAPEEVHNVTVSYKCGSNTIAEDQTIAAVGETTAKTVEASTIFGYTFESWTLGADVKTTDALTSNNINVNIVTGGSDFTLTANYTEIPKVTVYFVNNKKWSKVYAYGWGGSVGETPAWPGAEITANKEVEQIAGFDVHSYSVVPGSYVNLKFTNGSGTESNNFVWTDGKYYYMDAEANYVGGTKEEVTTILAPDPLATNVYLAGDMTNWGTDKVEFKKATAEGTTASVTVNLTAKSYTFQLVIDGNWYGNTGTMKRGGESVHEGGWSFEDTSYGANCTIVADFDGDYTFTWDLTNKKLTVAYPPLPKYTVSATAENGTVTGAGEYEHGSQATLVATPDAGYAFKNWTVGGTEKSTEATYTFTVNEPISLVANFIPEETNEVTISYLCGGASIPGHAATTLAVGVTTPSTITAPTITNYAFESWTVGNGVQTEDAATANPIHITTLASGEYTLTANYTKIELTYTVTVPEGTEKCYIVGAWDWNTFMEMTPTANANEFTITIDGATTAHKYKYACGPDWAYVEKTAEGEEVEDRTYNANDVVAKWAEPVKCYLMGNGDWVNGVEMTVNPENENEFVLLCHHISAPFKFKYGEEWSDQVENHTENGVAWVESEPGSGQNNITLPEGDYDFYFKKDTKKVWIGVCTPATPTPDYTRATTIDKFGTICLPFGSTNYTGAEFYEFVGSETGKAYIGSVTTLEAGIPYIFLATDTELAVYSDGTTAATPGNHNGLYGTFTNDTEVAVGNYILKDNAICECTSICYVNANRAYIVWSEIPTGQPSKVPGRKYIGMEAEGESTTTGLDNITNGENTVIKVIKNGQLIIIRGGEKYNAQGIKL